MRSTLNFFINITLSLLIVFKWSMAEGFQALESDGHVCVMQTTSSPLALIEDKTRREKERQERERGAGIECSAPCTEDEANPTQYTVIYPPECPDDGPNDRAGVSSESISTSGVRAAHASVKTHFCNFSLPC